MGAPASAGSAMARPLLLLLKGGIAPLYPRVLRQRRFARGVDLPGLAPRQGYESNESFSRHLATFRGGFGAAAGIRRRRGCVMAQKEDKERLPPFVPLLITTMESSAWRELSHGSKALYVSLKRHVRKGRNTAFLSHRDAVKELKSSRRKIAEWYAELEHYGFVVKISHGGIGLEGKGIAPHWRLTELGAMSNANASGTFEPPTAEFYRWDGTLFDPKLYRPRKQNPGSYGVARVEPTGEPRVAPTGEPPKAGGGSHGVAIERGDPGSHGGTITSGSNLT